MLIVFNIVLLIVKMLSIFFCVTDVVRCHVSEATDVAIEIPIKKWLSKAKERLDREKL